MIDSRKHLGNVRVVQRNLVYVTGIPAYLADDEVGVRMYVCMYVCSLTLSSHCLLGLNTSDSMVKS